MTGRNDGGGHPNSGGDTSSDRRYQALLLFGEVGADVLVIDGLLWFSNDSGESPGCPFSLLLRRPGSQLTEELLVGILSQCCDDGERIDILMGTASSACLQTAYGDIAVELTSHDHDA